MNSAIVFSRRVLLRSAATGEHVARPAAIFIKGDRIERVLETDAAPRGDAVEDLGDALVSPAFVNAHTHNAMNPLRGVGAAEELKVNVVERLFFRIERAFQPGDVRAFARMGAYVYFGSSVCVVVVLLPLL